MTTSARDGSGVRVPLRWRDLDHQGHVYHATVITLLDEARTVWLRDVVGVQEADAYVVAHIEVDYLAEIRIEGGAVDVIFTIRRIGRTSIRTEEVVRMPDGERVVVASTVVVLWDRSAHRSRGLTAEERSRAQEQLGNAGSVEAEAHA